MGDMWGNNYAGNSLSPLESDGQIVEEGRGISCLRCIVNFLLLPKPPLNSYQFLPLLQKWYY